MDPMFGFVAIRDSKAMDAARQKNSSYQKDLKRHITHLENQCQSKTTKICSDVGDLCQMLQDSNPGFESRVIFPRGMSIDKKEQYRGLRRGSVPSMTLEEFDNKLQEVREKREMERRSTEHHPRHKQVSNRNLKNTLSKEHLFKISPESKIVPETAYPAARRRSVVLKEALERSESADLQNLASVSDNLRLPAIHGDRRQSQPHILSSEQYQPKEDSDNVGTVGSILQVNRRRRDSRYLTSEGHQLNTSLRASINSQRRSTMPDIGGFTVHRQKYDCGDDETPDNSGCILSRLNGIIETWQSSPAVKPFSKDRNSNSQQ